MHLVSELDSVELVSGLQQLWSEGGGDELGVACQLHNHVWPMSTQPQRESYYSAAGRTMTFKTLSC